MTKKNNRFCESLEGYSRWKTRVVHIGQVPMGGSYPIRIQSMTNTNTLDTNATVEQCIRIANAGADYVRITTPTKKEAENLAEIKKQLIQRGCRIPLVADIHFNPDVAEVAARHVEKVRINPGNFTDKKSKTEYTEEEYRQELAHIRERMQQLVEVCKIYKTVIRIGVNHGSLSNRIVSKYGDTPEGMVESAMEFLRVCNELGYHEIVVSMKSSNTRVMAQSTRLLVNRMMQENMNYPLHLGVTEAGDGEDGRIRSAVGIGALLADGLGDTIRVSLTEDPEAEIPVAKALVCYYSQPVQFNDLPEIPVLFDPFSYTKRVTNIVGRTGDPRHPVVVTDLSFVSDMLDYDPRKVGLVLNNDGKLHPVENAPDYIYSGDNYFPEISPVVPQIVNYSVWCGLRKEQQAKSIPIFSQDEYRQASPKPSGVSMIFLREADLDESLLDEICSDKKLIVVVCESRNAPGFHEQRKVISALIRHKCKNPVIVYRIYVGEDSQTFMLESAADTGALFLDGLADGIWIGKTESLPTELIKNTSFNILQASRVRMSKTEFIACPSCGRTLFDLQDTLAKVKAATSHLKGLKIAVMGCIVNGPGEMADADYGYVGAGPGKISLYKRRELIRSGIDAANAVSELVALIKENGDWK